MDDASNPCGFQIADYRSREPKVRDGMPSGTALIWLFVLWCLRLPEFPWPVGGRPVVWNRGRLDGGGAAGALRGSQAGPGAAPAMNARHRPVSIMRGRCGRKCAGRCRWIKAVLVRPRSGCRARNEHAQGRTSFQSDPDLRVFAGQSHDHKRALRDSNPRPSD